MRELFQTLSIQQAWLRLRMSSAELQVNHMCDEVTLKVGVTQVIQVNGGAQNYKVVAFRKRQLR